MSAVSRVLGTYKLLKHLLLQLDNADMLDIVLSQRVNRTWRDVIRDSKRLRTVYWYQPPGIRPAMEIRPS